MLCILNGELIAQEKAHIGITDLALLRGYGIFDFFRLSDGVPLFFDDHLERFYKGAENASLSVPLTKDKFKSLLLQLFEENDMPVSGIRIILTGGYTPNGYSIGQPNLFVTQEPISFPSDEQYAHGVKLITHEYLRDLPHVKTINYMTGIWLNDKIKQEKAYDVIYTHENQVLELTRSNIFIVNNEGQIATPKDNMLHGITRKKVIESIDIEQRVVTKEELLEAKEVFITGTTKKVLSITQIDNKLIGDGKVGEVTKDVMQVFKNCEETYVKANG